MTKRTLVYIVVLFLFAFCSLVDAADFPVSTSADFQNALNTAQSNGLDDVITLSAGTYSVTSPDSFSYKAVSSDEGNNLTIIAEEGVYIDGQSSDKGLYVDIIDGDLVVRGITFQNCSSDQGAGAYLKGKEGSITLEECIFQNNKASGNGGGAYLDIEGNLLVDNCLFQDNVTFRYGGGLYAAIEGNAVLTLTNSQFLFNAASDDSVAFEYGGGAYLKVGYGEIELSGNTFENNSATDRAGALYAYVNDDGDINLVDNEFKQNTSTSLEGAAFLYIHGTGDITLEENLFENNTAANVSGALFARVFGTGNIFMSNTTFKDNEATVGTAGAAFLRCQYSGISVESCVFTGNVSATDAGALYTYSERNVETVILNSEFKNNSSGSIGGALYAYVPESGSGKVLLLNNVVAGNSSLRNGGGLCIDCYNDQYVDIDIINNTITGNVVSEELFHGGGIYLFSFNGSTVFNLYNNIIWDNTASAGDDIFINDAGNNAYFNLYNNDFSVMSQDFIGTESVLLKGDNIDVDPRFVSATDFHLQRGSPVIDMGNNNAPSLPETDLDGNARIYGSAVDMGAYEFTPVTSGGGGGGGCNAGALSLSLILLLAPLLLLAGKR